MEHGLSGTRTGVEHQAVSIANAIGFGNLARSVGDCASEGGVGSGQLTDVFIVSLGDDEYVGGCLRGDVTKREYLIGGQHNVGRDIPRHH